MRRGVWLALPVAILATTATAQVVTQNYNSLEYEYFNSLNDFPMTAGPLLTGGLYAPSYYHADDVDYYRIDVTNVPSTLTVRTVGSKSIIFGDCDPLTWLEDNLGAVLALNDNIAPPNNLDSYFEYVFTSPGDYYVGSQHAFTLWNSNASNYTLSGTYQYLDVDDQAPTYTGPAGVRGALRLSGSESQTALVSWYPATDNRTPSDQMKYNVYRATTPGAVFSGAPVTTFVGVLAGKVPGLDPDPSIDYWFGVRAEDEAGNEEQNTRVVKMANPLAVPWARWMLYR